MTLPEFLIAALGLLLTPGPTNTLLALAGSERGWRGALPLIPYELAGYLLVALPLALAGQAVLQAVPLLRPLVTAGAAAWVLYLALKLWRVPAADAPAMVAGRQVFVTTLLNPKALIFGLVLLPGAGLAGRVMLFAGLIAAVAAIWAGIGSCSAGRADCPARVSAGLIRRLAAVWLAALAVGLLLNAAHAAI